MTLIHVWTVRSDSMKTQLQKNVYNVLETVWYVNQAQIALNVKSDTGPPQELVSDALLPGVYRATKPESATTANKVCS
jgi:hypothetical protein